MAAFTRSESRGGRSQMSCCFCPITNVMRLKKSAWRRWGRKPATSARPALGWIRPLSILRVVVLPAPLGPRKPTISPGSTVKLTAFTASTSLVRRRTRWRRVPARPGCLSAMRKVLPRPSQRMIGMGGDYCARFGGAARGLIQRSPAKRLKSLSLLCTIA